MSASQPTLLSSRSLLLSDAASSVVGRIPELLRRLRDLESEEAELNAKARELVGQLPETQDWLSTPSRHSVTTPVSKLRGRTTVDRGTPPHIDPRNIETPMKTFLLEESFALAMSIKSKRKGRIFLADDSTEFGEKRRN